VAHPEIILLTKVIEECDFRALKNNGIDRGFFATIEGKGVYDFISRQFHNRNSWGSTPSMSMVQHVVKTFTPVHTTDDIDGLIQFLLREKTRRDLLKLSDDIHDMVHGTEVETTIQHIAGKLGELSKIQSQSRDLDLAANVSVIKERYLTVAAGDGVLGIPFPWAPMTEATLGLQPGQFILIYGRPGQMKSWMAVAIAVHAYLCGCRVLFYTREMTEEEILMRVAATIAGVNYDDFRKGQLPEAVEIETFEILDGLARDEEVLAGVDGRQRQCFKVSTAGELALGNTVEGIRAKVEEYKIDIVIADGVYRMGDNRTRSHKIDWQNVTHVAQDLKELAKKHRIPLVGVTQANRKHEMAFADALLQECDFAFRLVLHEKENTLNIITGKLRDGRLRAFAINAYPAANFTLKEELSEEEANELTAREDAQGRNSDSKRRGGGNDGGGTSRVAPRVFRQ